MKLRRLLLLVVLSVSLDATTPFLPGAAGVQWDDEDEAVHGRRSAPARRPGLATPAPPTTSTIATRVSRLSTRRRAPARAARDHAVAIFPPAHAHPSLSDPAASGEDH